MDQARERKDEEFSCSNSVKVQQKCFAADDAVQELWPVPFKKLIIPTRFGPTAVIACGKKEAPPVVLLYPGGEHPPVWARNVEVLCQSYRVYAVDVISVLKRSIPRHPIRSHQKLMDWMTDLFDGLQIGSADLVSSSNGWFFALDTALYLPRRAGWSQNLNPMAT